jgi:hypothetical protein
MGGDFIAFRHLPPIHIESIFNLFIYQLLLLFCLDPCKQYGC